MHIGKLKSLLEAIENRPKSLKNIMNKIIGELYA